MGKTGQREMKHLNDKLAFWKNGEILVGMVVLLSGIYVGWQGFTKLRELWTFFSSYLPLALPEDVAERALASLPLISKVFINTVGSMAAVLMGVAWVLSGLGEALQAGQKPPEPSDVEKPELVAEFLRTGRGQYWKSSPGLVRLAGSLFPRARLISPISYKMAGSVVWASLKVVLVGIAIAGVWHLFRIIPAVVKTYFHRDMILVVPSAGPLFSLLGFVVCVHVLIALSLMPFKRPRFLRTCNSLSVRGSRDPNGFFALLEEGCRLLNAVGIPQRAPARLGTDADTALKATLVETTPEPLRSVARPAGYFCLPLVFFPVTMGFTRLIHFHRSVDSMPYQEFLTTRLLSYSLDVAFALALIVVGLHFSEQARRLFGIRRFRSALIFAFVKSDISANSGAAARPVLPDAVGDSGEIMWKAVHGADDRFASWARAPQVSGTFGVDLFWAEAFSESATTGGPRFVIDLQQSNALDEAMEHIVKIPFHVAFVLDAPPASAHIS
jgi:hypothetical protein